MTDKKKGDTPKKSDKKFDKKTDKVPDDVPGLKFDKIPDPPDAQPETIRTKSGLQTWPKKKTVSFLQKKHKSHLR